MIYKLTYQTRGKSGWFSHPKVFKVSDSDISYMLEYLKVDENIKYAVWVLSANKWQKIAEKKL